MAHAVAGTAERVRTSANPFPLILKPPMLDNKLRGLRILRSSFKSGGLFSKGATS